MEWEGEDERRWGRKAEAEEEEADWEETGRFDTSSYELDFEETQRVCEYLSSSPFLKTLCWGKVCEQGEIELAHLLSVNKNIAVLEICHQTEEKESQRRLEIILTNKNLSDNVKELHMYDCVYLNTEPIAALFFRPSGCFLSTLCLLSCGITGEGAKNLLDSLSFASSSFGAASSFSSSGSAFCLQRLFLSGNKFGQDKKAITSLCTFISTNRTVSVLELDECDIGLNSLTPLGEALEHNTSLKHLSLLGNRFVAFDAEPLMAADLRMQIFISP